MYSRLEKENVSSIVPTPLPEIKVLPQIPGNCGIDTSKFPEIFDDFKEWETFTKDHGIYSLRIPIGVKLKTQFSQTPTTHILWDSETAEEMMIRVFRTTDVYETVERDDIIKEVVRAYGLPETQTQACGIASVKPGWPGCMIADGHGYYIIQKESANEECQFDRTEVFV